MADRHQNINISYNVKTTDLERIEGIAVRAEAATKKLEQSATNLGSKGARSTQPYLRSIESVRTEMQRTRTLIGLTSRSDTKLLNERTSRYKALKKEVDDFNKRLGTQQKQTQSLTSQFNGLYNAVKLVFTAAIVKEVVGIGLSMARLQGNVEGVDRAFRRAIPNAGMMLRRLRDATHGTVGDLELMQRALRAQNLGVPIERLGTLMEFASIRAQQTGESVDYLIDSIVTGLGRKSTRVIDNLGISATRLKDAMGGVSLEAATVGQVTEAVVGIASEEIQKMGGFVETAETKVKQLENAWSGLRIEVAKAFETGDTIDFIKDYVTAFQTLVEAQNRGITVAEVLADRERKRVAAMETELFLQRNLTGEREKDIQFLEQTIAVTQKDILTRNNLIAKLNQGLQAMKDELATKQATGVQAIIERSELQKNIEQRQKVIEELISEKSHREEWLKIYLQTINAIKQENEVLEEQLGLIPEVEKQISDLNDKIAKSRNEQHIAKWNQEIFILQGRLHELKTLGLPEFRSPEVLERVGKIIDEKIKKGFADSNRELSNIEDTIERLKGSIVPVTIKTHVDIRPMDFFDHLEESVRENWQELSDFAVNSTADFLMASREAELQSYQQRIDDLQSFYDEQILLAGDNERAKDQLRLQEQRRTDELRKEQARKEKEARRFSIIVDTAAALARIWIQPGWPLALAFTPLIIANAAMQLSALNKAQPRGFFKGEVGIDGPGTSRSDSIPAMLSKGESVINAEATKKSFGLLEAINARKIDDRVLQELQLTKTGVSVTGMNPKPIVDAINAASQRQPDIIRMGSQLFEAKNISANHKRYVRSKHLGKPFVK